MIIRDGHHEWLRRVPRFGHHRPHLGMVVAEGLPIEGVEVAMPGLGPLIEGAVSLPVGCSQYRDRRVLQQPGREALRLRPGVDPGRDSPREAGPLPIEIDHRSGDELSCPGILCSLRPDGPS